MYKIIVVADAKHARFFESSGIKVDGEILALESGKLGINHNTQDPRDAFSGTHGTRSHAFSSHNDPHDLERDDFSKVVANKLHHLCNEGHKKIVEIIIVAPAKMLGDLRHHLSKDVQNIGVREIVKDLTHMQKDKIEEIVFGK